MLIVSYRVSFDIHSIDRAEQLGFQDELPLLVLLILLKGLVILPTDSFFALFAANVSDQVFPCCHVSFICGPFVDVHDFGKEISLAVLAAKIL